VRKAVVDVGSNSVLLLVAELGPKGWQAVVETSEVTGLGAGTKASGLLSEEGMNSTLAAVRRAFDRAGGVGAETIVAAATMAARIASNTATFLDRARAQGTPVSVLSGEEEAELGLQSVISDPAFAAYSTVSIIDVGGHSTEVVTSEGGHIKFKKSFAVGTLGLRGSLLQDEAPDVMARMRAVHHIDEHLGFSTRPGAGGHAVALGATATNLVTIREQMAEWQPERVHGAYLDYEEISRAAGWLCGMTDAQRAALIGIEKGREGTIHIGALILERCLYALRLEGCSVSVRGWRHALLERLG
jgi:exopolyphosphatase / guanosine-5'-triphosphate,3'-diphosphate pyrophosphatase